MYQAVWDAKAAQQQMTANAPPPPPAPGRPGLLVLSFATPVEPLAEALVMLFDAIAESLRCTR